ncbi:MAG: double zinc ribbon domain-containing protein [Nitrospinota bacterium]
MQRFLNLLSGLSDIILPRSCPTCGGALPFGGGRAICETCLEALERTLPPWCPVCGKPFRSEFTLSYSPDHLCAECREWPPDFDGARALGPYDGALRNLVHLIKYHGYTSLAAELGVELSQRARQEFPGAADAGDGLITFVPIARKPGKSAASIRPGFSPRAPPGAWEWHSRPLSRGEPPRPPRHA